MVPALSHRVSRVPWYSGLRRASSGFAYGALTLSGRPSQGRLAALSYALWRSLPQRARALVWAPPGSLAATSGIDVSFFSSGYLDVSVHRVPSSKLYRSPCFYFLVTGVSPAGFPHSDTRGSLPICGSPRRFAAYRVFLRPLVPRHPPRSLFRLTFLPA